MKVNILDSFLSSVAKSERKAAVKNRLWDATRVCTLLTARNNKGEEWELLWFQLNWPHLLGWVVLQYLLRYLPALILFSQHDRRNGRKEKFYKCAKLTSSTRLISFNSFTWSIRIDAVFTRIYLYKNVHQREWWHFQTLWRRNFFQHLLI